MKVLRKSEIVRLMQVEHINSERTILDRVRHPFVVELYATYQDNLNVYMLLSYIPGGELFSHLRRAGRFSADVTRFYLACIVLAIEYLHAKNIIYRDLKPENLLLDRTGYLRIADFGFAKVVEDRTFTLCGTPEYLAPEIVLSQGHGKAVDWWALGILAFEMLAGYPPFFDDHPLGIYEKILRNEIAFPSYIDPYAKDLIKGLLTADRSKRMGNLKGGAKDVMNHPWFAGVDWGSLERKEIGAPIVPRVASMGECCRILPCLTSLLLTTRRRLAKLPEVSSATASRAPRDLWTGLRTLQGRVLALVQGLFDRGECVAGGVRGGGEYGLSEVSRLRASGVKEGGGTGKRNREAEGQGAEPFLALALDSWVIARTCTWTCTVCCIRMNTLGIGR
jgi:serine/threonine protein kinase